MRNLLLVAFFVRPRRGVGGNRIQNLRNYLPKFGWNVTTLTARFDEPVEDPSIVQTPYVDIAETLKRLIGIRGRSAHEALGATVAAYAERKTIRQRAIELTGALTTYPDAEVGWFTGGRKQLARLLATRRFDAVVTSSPPFISNLMLASLRLRIPWIADFRDLWGDTDSYVSGLRRQLDLNLERWALRRAAAATAVSEPMAAVIRSHAPRLRVDAITNAFDPVEWKSIPFDLEPVCTFVYAGTLFRGRRNPRPLFAAVRRLIDEHAIDANEIRIDFYSAIEPWLCESIESHGLKDIVRIRGVVPREEVLYAQRSADRLLVFLWDAHNSHVLIPGKVSEYLGARRMILATGGGTRSAVDSVFEQTDAGVRARDDVTLQNEILQAVRERRSGNVRVIHPSRLTLYEAQSLAQQFASLLEHVIDNRRREEM